MSLHERLEEHTQKQEYHQAILLLEEELDQEPHHVEYLFLLSQFHLKAKNYLSALTCLRQVIALGGQGIDIEEGLLVTLFETHHFAEAHILAIDLCQRVPQRPLSWRNLGYLQDRNQEDSQQAFQNAYIQDPLLYPLPFTLPEGDIFSLVWNRLPKEAQEFFHVEVLYEHVPSKKFLMEEMFLQSPLITFSLSEGFITIYRNNLRYSAPSSSEELLYRDLLFFWKLHQA